MPSEPPDSPDSIASLSPLSLCSPASAVCSAGGWLGLDCGWPELAGGWLELELGGLELGGLDGGLDGGGVELGVLGVCGAGGVLALGHPLSIATAASSAVRRTSLLVIEWCLWFLVGIAFLYYLRCDWLTVDHFRPILHALEFSQQSYRWIVVCFVDRFQLFYLH